MTYNPALTSATDRLRFMLGDIDTAELLPDATYAAVITTSGDDERAAAITLANGLIARFAHLPTQVDNTGGARVTWQNRLAGWQALITRLQAEIAAEAVAEVVTTAPTSARAPVRGVW